jgi:hypothetical protein
VLLEELWVVERGTDRGAVRLDVLVVAAMDLAGRGAGRSTGRAVCLDVLVVAAMDLAGRAPVGAPVGLCASTSSFSG